MTMPTAETRNGEYTVTVHEPTRDELPAGQPTTDGITLLAELAELGARVTAAMATAIDDPDVLTNATTQLLIRLRTHGSSRPSDLAHHFGVSRPQITKLVGQLEHHHLIERRYAVETDRRAVTIALTPAGERVLDSADELLQRGFDDVRAFAAAVTDFLARTSD